MLYYLDNRNRQKKMQMNKYSRILNIDYKSNKKKINYENQKNKQYCGIQCRIHFPRIPFGKNTH